MFWDGKDLKNIFFLEVSWPRRSTIKKNLPIIFVHCYSLVCCLQGWSKEISAHDAQSIFSFSAGGLDMDPIYDLLINRRGLRPPIHFTGAHEHLPAGVGFHHQVQAKSCRIQQRESWITSSQYWECSLPALKSQEIHNHRKNCTPVLHKLWAGRCNEEEGWERSRWNRNRTEFIVFLVCNLN